jgi:hypothetical protein
MFSSVLLSSLEFLPAIGKGKKKDNVYETMREQLPNELYRFIKSGNNDRRRTLESKELSYNPVRYYCRILK